MKGKKKMISSKIQRENCKIEINEHLIKCLQNLALCQLVNCSSAHLSQILTQDMWEVVWFTACGVVWRADSSGQAVLGPLSVFKLPWVPDLLFTYHGALGKSLPLKLGLSFFVC